MDIPLAIASLIHIIAVPRLLTIIVLVHFGRSDIYIRVQM